MSITDHTSAGIDGAGPEARLIEHRTYPAPAAFAAQANVDASI